MNVNVKSVLDQVGKGFFGASNEGMPLRLMTTSSPPPFGTTPGALAPASGRLTQLLLARPVMLPAYEQPAAWFAMQLQPVIGATVHKAYTEAVTHHCLLMPAKRTLAEGGDEEVESLLQRVAEGVLPEDRREALQLLQDAITDDAKARHI